MSPFRADKSIFIPPKLLDYEVHTHCTRIQFLIYVLKCCAACLPASTGATAAAAAVG